MVAWLSMHVLVSTALAAKPRYCWVPSRLKYAGRDSIEYIPLEEAQRREVAAAKLEMRTPSELKAGWLAVKVERNQLEEADPANHLVVLLRDGIELARIEPESKVPNIGDDLRQFWWAYASVQLPEDAIPPFEVRVIDKLHQWQCRWRVEASGEVVLIRDK